jgi:hypothetical protein
MCAPRAPQSSSFGGVPGAAASYTCSSNLSALLSQRSIGRKLHRCTLHVPSRGHRNESFIHFCRLISRSIRECVECASIFVAAACGRVKLLAPLSYANSMHHPLSFKRLQIRCIRAGSDTMQVGKDGDYYIDYYFRT